MIDLHFHALPGVDDGPPDMKAALALARAAEAVGVDAVVATPHVNWHWANSAEAISAAVRHLSAELASRSIRLRVYPGAEVDLTRACDLPDAVLQSLQLGGGPWMLVEAPHTPGIAGVENMLRHLAARGHHLVLAHVERCPAFLADADLLGRMVGCGMLASITAGSLTGRFGGDALRAAERFLAAGLIHNVASDAHDTRDRAPGLTRELEKAGLGAQASWLIQEVPAAILDGTTIPPAPTWPTSSPRRRRWLSS